MKLLNAKEIEYHELASKFQTVTDMRQFLKAVRNKFHPDDIQEIRGNNCLMLKSGRFFTYSGMTNNFYSNGVLFT